MQQSNSVKITAMIIGAIVILVLIGVFVYFRENGTTITANGVSQVKATPDLISVYFSVETNGTTSKEAGDTNSKIVDDLTTALIKQGFAMADIQTNSFSINPMYNWDGSQQIQTGYQAVHSIKVELSTAQTNKIGDVVDAGINAGAGVSYINFELSQTKQNELKAQALQQATQDAKIKVDSIASGLGKTVGRVVSVTTSDFNYMPWLAYSNAGMASPMEVKAAATSIQPSEQTVNANVQVVFAIN